MKLFMLCSLIALLSSASAFADPAPVLTFEPDVQIVHDVGSMEDYVADGVVPAQQRPSFLDLAGAVIDWTNEYGHSALTLGVDGSLEYNDDNGARGLEGKWWVDPASMLCIVSKTYWRHGNCFILRGTKKGWPTSISPLTRPDVVYPVSRRD